MKLPQRYHALSTYMRRKVREEYVKRQNGLCYHCGAPLNQKPTLEVSKLKVDKRLFPEGFFDYPVHLHHNHETGMTIGAVHNYCNAVLFQYHGE